MEIEKAHILELSVSIQSGGICVSGTEKQLHYSTVIQTYISNKNVLIWKLQL